MTQQSIIQVTLWNSLYLGNFMSSELAFARAVRARFGLATHFVLGDGAEGQWWLENIEAQGDTWSVVPARRWRWHGHIKRVAREHDAALLHTHFTAADLQAASIAAKAGVPCVWHIRTGFTSHSPQQHAKDVLKWRIIAQRRVASIVAVSTWLGELVRRRGAPSERVEVVPNPIMLDRFERLPDRAHARERFGLEPHAEVVLALGWWPEVKGVDVLLSALEAIAERHPSMNALLVGNEQMDEYLAEHVPDKPRWLRTSPFVEDAAWLFAAADAFVSASRHEGQSSAIGEAIACGLPVVMSDIAGTAAWAEAPNVLTFPSGDAAALAARLEQLFAQSSGARAASSAKNREWAYAHLGHASWCERLCEIYGELLERATPVSRDGARRHAA